VYTIEYLTTQIELVLPIFKSWTVYKIIEYLTLGLLSSLWNIYHSTTAYFFDPPCIFISLFLISIISAKCQRSASTYVVSDTVKMLEEKFSIWLKIKISRYISLRIHATWNLYAVLHFKWFLMERRHLNFFHFFLNFLGKCSNVVTCCNMENILTSLWLLINRITLIWHVSELLAYLTTYLRRFVSLKISEILSYVQNMDFAVLHFFLYDI